jgi:entry exclusion lipoprotein TrbK
MHIHRLALLGASAILAVVLAGCNKMPDPQVASPECAPLASMTAAQKADPAIQAELIKKCPRAGPGFKASPKQEY